MGKSTSKKINKQLTTHTTFTATNFVAKTLKGVNYE